MLAFLLCICIFVPVNLCMPLTLHLIKDHMSFVRIYLYWTLIPWFCLDTYKHFCFSVVTLEGKEKM